MSTHLTGSTRAQGALRHFIAVTSEISPAIAVRGAVPHEWERMREHAQAVTAWAATLVEELQKAEVVGCV